MAGILIVDDEIDIAKDLQSRLTALGYEVIVIAASGREALSLVERERPDVILMDILLHGGMDGIETATEIRKRWPIPVIYSTCCDYDDMFELAKYTKPYGYLVKPFSDRDLKYTIELAMCQARTKAPLPPPLVVLTKEELQALLGKE
jgi:CheY-like chemotaxis protein